MTGIDGGISVLVIGAIMAIATTIQTMLNNRAAAKRQEADWERQDEVAMRAQRAASLLVSSNEKIAAEAKKTSAALIESGKNIQSNVDAVREIALNTQGLAVTTHGVVNGALTAVKQAELNGWLRERDLMRRLPDISRKDLELIDAKITGRQIELDELTKESQVTESQGKS